MTKIPYLYFHGGPGMNSLGEQALLGPAFRALEKEIHFWSEPRSSETSFNPQQAFTGWMESARSFLEHAARQHGGPVHVLAHSFAAQGLCRIAFAQPELFQSLTLIAPVLDADAWLRNVLRIAADDFDKIAPSKANDITEALGASTSCFDGPMQSAFMIAAQDAVLFTNYWCNADRMNQFFDVWQKNAAGLDANAFFSVLGEFAQSPIFEQRRHDFKAPVRVILGKHDRVSTAKLEVGACHRLYGDLTVHYFDESAHFPHLEETDRFLEVLGNLPAAEENLLSPRDHELVVEKDRVRSAHLF